MSSNKYTDQDLINVLQNYYKENNKVPTSSNFMYLRPSNVVIRNRFGTWENALKKADLFDLIVPKNRILYSDEFLLDQLKIFCNTFNKFPLESDLKNNGYPSITTYNNRFNSMQNALKLINFDHLITDKIKRRTKKYTKEDIVIALKSFCNKENRFPVYSDFAKLNPSSTTVIKFFNNNWDNVLLEIKNHFPQFSEDIDKYINQLRHNDEYKKYLIDKLIELYNKLGRIPTHKDIDSDKEMPSSSMYNKIFGNFKNALKEAKLFDYVQHKGKYKKFHYTDDELLELLNNFISIHNKVPTRHELNYKYDMPTIETYTSRFGSYLNALNLIGKKEEYLKNNPSCRRYTEQEILDSLYKLYLELGKVPNFNDIDECDYTPQSTTYYSKYGNLTNVFDLINIPYNKSDSRKYNKFGKYFKNYITEKGTKCLSKSEYIITNWLEDNFITFNKEVYYKTFLNNDNSSRRLDWLIIYNNKKYYVEYFGMMHNKSYKEEALQKIEDCKNNNIDLIAIYPKDLKTKTVEEIFSFLD